ncbi:MAG: patatin-like phospholipase family protein [Actinomycetota bacterium]
MVGPPAIGVVLGGGGIAGYAFHAAVLAALEDRTGFDPRTASVVVGTSAGSIAGAVIRGDVPAAALRERLASIHDNPRELADLRLLAGRSPRAIPRFWAGPSSPGLAVRELRQGRNLRLTKLVGGLLPQGRLTLGPIREPLERLHRDRWPDRQLWVPATDLATGHRVVFGRDEYPTVADAVTASCALPGFFAPARVGERTYIDGGLASPFNADLLVGHMTPDERPLDLVIVIAPLSIDELRRGQPMASAVRSLPRRRLHGEVRRLGDAGAQTMVIQPGRAVARAMGLNPMDPNRVRAIMARAEELVDRQLVVTDEAVRNVLEEAARTLPSPADVAYPRPLDRV